MKTFFNVAVLIFVTGIVVCESAPAPVFKKTGVADMISSNPVFGSHTCCRTENKNDTFEWQLHDDESGEFQAVWDEHCIDVPKDLGITLQMLARDYISFEYRVCATNQEGDNTTCSDIKHIVVNRTLNEED
jgi:hypothetical protein